ncbi:MAG TPA: PfkB family carbohydrate kinase [Nitrososphaerales archaeon]|nr:PfkB family carbohydrate kinase [Nitrososphaerales archaeon]
MKILVAGFLTIDSIQLPTRQVTSVGGPPSYAGLMCARFGHTVTPLTKVGSDFPDEQSVWLARNGIVLRASDRSLTKPTTRFRIAVSSGNRTLYLASRCEDLTASQIVPDTRFNAALVSPIAGEVSSSLLTELSSRSDFTFLDPQGYVRTFAGDGRVSSSPVKDRSILSKVDAIKMDRTEAEMLTGKGDPKEALEKLSAIGVRKGIVTQGGDACHVLDGSRIYRVEVPKSPVLDTTGAGDILVGATASWYLKTRDFLRSACFGIAASSLSLQMIALAKVDLPMSVDDSAQRLFSSANPVAAI